MLGYNRRRRPLQRKTRMDAPNRRPVKDAVSRAGMRLSTRVQVIMALSTAVVFTVIATIVGLGVTQYSRSLAADEAKRQLDMISVQFDLEASRLDALIAGFCEYGAATGDDTHDAALSLERWLATESPADVMVRVGENGDVSASRGNEDDAAALLSLLSSHPGGVRGPVLLPSGPAVVAVRAGGLGTGTTAIARPLSESLVTVDKHTTELLPPTPDSADGSDPRGIPLPAGYLTATADTRDGLFITHATLTGVDGQPAVTVVIERPDPGLGQGRLWLVLVVPIALGLVTVGLGYLLGMAVGRSVTRPLHRFVTYLQEQGYMALQGLRTDDGLIVEPGLPGDFAELGGVIHDLMTQLRINQAELMEANDQALAAERAFRTVVEESPEVKILVRGGVVEIANPAAAHFFGLRLGDLLRAEPDGLFAGVEFFDEEGGRVGLLDIARENSGQASVVRCVTGDDRAERWMEISVAFIDPDAHDYVISARDITEQRRLEALREEVLSLASHDLRSPLTVVRGYLDILDTPIPDAQRQKAVGGARRATERLESLLNDLLYATRADRVLAPQVLRPVDLSALAHSVAASLQIGALQAIKVSAAEPMVVLGDSDRLEQAITNLVGNAIKHGPAEGVISVGVASVDGHARVTVSDEGPGIPEEQRESLFDRGVRGSSDAPGSGLGLYIVRVVAEAHNGQAFVEPDDGGTRFVIDLPLMAENEGPS
ncbi:MAG: Multi-sensor signal transduction histidine kinase [Actinobacteria bacterium 66_15]|nr:MAG: Multi-sensor signal transduction histidine kinase [Actinobacteria bacterium 66_15]